MDRSTEQATHLHHYMKIVLANGVFDILHYGHLLHLREARAMGDYLIVSVTADQHVNKGFGRPINPLAKRMEMLIELRCVNQVFGTSCAVSAILRVKPHIFVKGIDYAGGDKFSEDVARACAKVGAEIRYTQTPKMSVTEDIIAKTHIVETATGATSPARRISASEKEIAKMGIDIAIFGMPLP